MMDHMVGCGGEGGLGTDGGGLMGGGGPHGGGGGVIGDGDWGGGGPTTLPTGQTSYTITLLEHISHSFLW